MQTALAFSKFFYPDVLEFDGYFLLKDRYDAEIFQGWKQRFGADKARTEKAMNHYEVNDFFCNNYRDDETDEQVVVLGRVLQVFWDMSFKRRYPDRNIEVLLFEEEDVG